MFVHGFLCWQEDTRQHPDCTAERSKKSVTAADADHEAYLLGVSILFFHQMAA